MNTLKHLIRCFCVAASLIVIYTVLFVRASPSLNASASATEGQSLLQNSTNLFLPFVRNDQLLSWRMGFGAGADSSLFSSYPELDSLKAGWYLNWTVRAPRPTAQGIEFVPVVRLHQRVTCPVGTTPDREVCPYIEPYEYTLSPNRYTITTTAIAAPGSTWLIGNEVDRKDWGNGGHQDEMLPELYAVAYNELYFLIKGADPTAKIAVSGVIQATPLRLAYMTKVWNTYIELYGESMPVDIWNVHAFILPEIPNSAGADIPPGSDATGGANLQGPAIHINMDIFADQIVAFRQWMKEKGQQDKPLIVTEYGVLYHNLQMGLPGDPQIVADFMVNTFDYFLNSKDCDLGYIADDCRLVQRWIWFSLDSQDFNPYGRLFNPNTHTITPLGQAFRDYSLNHLYELSGQAY